MANWQRNVNLANVIHQYRSDEISIYDLSGKVAKILKMVRPFGIEDVDNELTEIVKEFEAMAADTTADVNEFDDILNRLYDWGDIKLDDNWNGKKVAWVKTN